MRRMRDIPWPYWLLSIPAVGAALGVQYWVRNRLPTLPVSTPETASVLKPSFFWPDSATGSEYAVRGLAAALKGPGWKPAPPALVSPGYSLPVYERSDEPEDELFPEDEESIAAFLDATYYRFREK